MRANAWQSPFSARGGIPEDVLDAFHHGFLPFRDLDLDHVETPGNLPGAKAAKPFVGTALDQGLLLAVDGSQAAHDRPRFPRFHLDEQQLPALAGDNINLPSFPALEIAGKDLAIVRPQPVRGDFFPVVTRPFPRAAGPRPRVVGRVEIPAETSDDDGGKAHGS